MAKKIKSKTADSSNTKITETVQASQTGHFATINACACNGKRYTNERTNESIPKINVKRKGHNVFTHNYSKKKFHVNIIAYYFFFKKINIYNIPVDVIRNKLYQRLDKYKVEPFFLFLNKKMYERKKRKVKWRINFILFICLIVTYRLLCTTSGDP